MASNPVFLLMANGCIESAEVSYFISLVSYKNYFKILSFKLAA